MGGAPKGLSIVGGQRILDRLIELSREAFGSLPLLIANQPAAPSWTSSPLRIVADQKPGAGTLGGLYTAVVEAPAPVVVVAWDMPFLTTGLLVRLAEGLARADAFLPESENRRGVEPLCAAYGPAVAGPMEEAIARGDLRAIAFHDRVRVGILSLAEVANFGNPAELFLNVNTPGDLERAGGHAAPRAPGARGA
jgi:molybdopterin-guanine dinucleotide biosynthesis protein A